MITMIMTITVMTTITITTTKPVVSQTVSKGRAARCGPFVFAGNLWPVLNFWLHKGSP